MIRPIPKRPTRSLRGDPAETTGAGRFGFLSTTSYPYAKIRGDGEQLILDILEHMDDPAGVEGVTWAKDGKVVSNPNRKMERNLDQWPFPDRESLKLDFVESMPLDVPCVLSLERFTTMQTSRGACVFCDIPVFNEGKWRSRTPHSTSWTSSSISSDLFACRWLRASKNNDEGLADAVSEAHGHAGRGREEP